MMRALFRDTIIYGVSAVLSRGLSIVAVPIYSRILSPGEYGALDMIMVLAAFATLIVALEIAQGFVRLSADAQTPGDKQRLASTALWFTIAAYTVAILAALAAAKPLASWLIGSEEMAGALRVGLAGIAATGIFYLAQTQLRFERRSTAYACLSLLYSIGVFGLGVLFGFGFGLGLMGVLWGQFIGTAIAAALGLYLLRRSYALQWDGALLRGMLIFSLPLVPSGLATFLTLHSNRLLLNTLVGLDAVGIFGVAARVAGVVTLLIMGLKTALTPLIYDHYKEPGTPRQLAQLTEEFSAFALFCCLGLGLFAEEVLALFVEPRYIGAAPLVLFLAPAALLGQMYIFFPGIAIAKRMRLQLYIFVVTALASLLFNWLFIRAWGPMGAAIATLLSSIIFLGLWIAVSQPLYQVEIQWRRLGATIMLFAVAAGAGVWLQMSDFPQAWIIAGKASVILLFVLGAMLCGLLRSFHLIFAAGGAGRSAEATPS